MPLTIPAGYGLAAIVLTADEGTAPFVTTIGINLGDSASDQALADLVFEAYNEAWLPVTSSALTLQRVTLSTTEGGVGGSTDSTHSPQTGGRSGGNQPILEALMLSKVTATSGRRGRGRMFLPGVLTTGDVDLAGTINGSTQASYQTHADAFFSGINEGVGGADHAVPVLLHSDATSPSPITALRVLPMIGSLRKRLR